MPKPYDAGIDGAFQPCPVCVATDFHLRDIGPHIARVCGDGHRQGDWIAHSDFREGGKYHGMLPPGDFSPQCTRRASRFSIKEHISYAVRQSERCFYCGQAPFKPPQTAKAVREWLENEKATLWNLVREHFRRTPEDFAVVPADWSAAIPTELRDEILRELDGSRLRADHLVPVAILKLLDGIVLKKELNFGGRELAVPACSTCNRGRVPAGMEAPQVLLDRWVSFYFDGNRIAARADPAWPMVDTLVREGYKIASDLRRLQRGTLAL